MEASRKAWAPRALSQRHAEIIGVSGCLSMNEHAPCAVQFSKYFLAARYCFSWKRLSQNNRKGFLGPTKTGKPRCLSGTGGKRQKNGRPFARARQSSWHLEVPPHPRLGTTYPPPKPPKLNLGPAHAAGDFVSRSCLFRCGRLRGSDLKTERLFESNRHRKTPLHIANRHTKPKTGGRLRVTTN